MGDPLSDPVFLVEALPDGDTAVLAGPEGRHAARVRRITAGERVDLTDGGGGVAHCIVREVGGDRLELSVRDRRYDPPPVPRLVVVQALVKGERGELAVELMTELGVDEVVPWAAARSIAVWRGDRAGKGLDRWRSAARAAAKQSRRAWLPDVLPLCGTADVAERLRAATTAIVLDADAGQPLSTLTLPRDGEIVVVVGPEGGITPDELATFTAAGAIPCRLGPTVLRTSTAGAAALAAVSARVGRWG